MSVKIWHPVSLLFCFISPVSSVEYANKVKSVAKSKGKSNVQAIFNLLRSTGNNR